MDLSESTIEIVPRSPSFYGGRPEDAMSGLSSGERRSFYIRLAERTMARGDPTRHVTVHMIGVLRPPANKKDQKNKKKGTYIKLRSNCALCSYYCFRVITWILKR